MSEASYCLFCASNSSRSSGRTISSSRSAEMAMQLLSVSIWISLKSLVEIPVKKAVTEFEHLHLCQLIDGDFDLERASY